MTYHELLSTVKMELKRFVIGVGAMCACGVKFSVVVSLNFVDIMHSIFIGQIFIYAPYKHTHNNGEAWNEMVIHPNLSICIVHDPM